MDDDQREIVKALRTSQDKYVYFLLAAAGAGIGLAVNLTQDEKLMFSHIPLAATVLSWGVSFFFGGRHLAYVSATLYANAELFRVQQGQHPEVGAHPQMMDAAVRGIEQAIEHNSERANRFAHWQFRFLIAGAVLFVLWHVLEMYLRQ